MNVKYIIFINMLEEEKGRKKNTLLQKEKIVAQSIFNVRHPTYLMKELQYYIVNLIEQEYLRE